MNQQKAFFKDLARNLILELREAQDVSYAELARRLEEHGSVQSRQTLTNKLNRGVYSFEFALQVLAALGVTNLRVPQLPTHLRRAPREHSTAPIDDA
jgi:transcriptional regulator with XRE-family HTH domain